MTSPARIDPSRTKTLRDKFRREFLRRFEKLKRLINDLVITEDAFGIAPASKNTSRIAFDTTGLVGNITQNNRWRFRTDSEKLQLFGVWLSQQISEEIIQDTEIATIEDAYWYSYVWEGYQRGVGRIFTDLNKLSSITEDISDVFVGSKKEFLRQSFSHPVSVERVKQVASRVLTDLKGVTDAMEAQIKRELIDGLTQGLQPKEVARRLNDRVDKIGKTRANTIAQTECLLPDTLVDSAMVRAAFRRWYEGDVVEIKTRNGRQFTTTPNHPMLTQDGWISSGSLNKGHQLICDSRNKNLTLSGDVDIKRSPTKISEIFSTLQTVGVFERRRSREPDFHGDGVNGYVDVASTNRELMYGNFSPILEPLANNVFSVTGLSASSFCLFCSRLLPVNKGVCFCPTSQRYSRTLQPIFDSISICFESLGKTYQGLSRFVSLDNVINRKVMPELVGFPSLNPSEFLSIRDRPTDSSLSKDFSNLFLIRSNMLSNCSLSHSRHVELDDVISVRFRPFSGHVYNLETKDGYFNIANGVYTGNTIRAHAEGQLDGLERYGLDEIGVMSEWTTSGLGISGKGNPSPCDLCAPLDGLVLTVKEARGLIPRHPNCKCTFKPANVGEPLIGREKRFYDPKTKKVITRKQKQIRTKDQIERALKKSKSARKGSQWVGDDLKISKKRPPSPVN